MRYEIGDIVTLSFLDYVFVVIKCTEAKGQEPVYDLRGITRSRRMEQQPVIS